jgi:hypothetical protein
MQHITLIILRYLAYANVVAWIRGLTLLFQFHIFRIENI